LNDDKEQRLVDEGFIFDTSTASFKFITSGWRRAKDDWDCRFEELQEYIKKHGSMNNLPRRANPRWPLVGWVYRQRVQYRRMVRGEPNRLTEERVALLRSVNFDFSFEKSLLSQVLAGEEKRVTRESIKLEAAACGGEESKK
jgi:Helicase associated domain